MLKTQYEGTFLGKQEIEGLIIENNNDALWSHDMIKYATQIPDLKRIVVAIDPAVTLSKNSDETGIVIAGIADDKGGIRA